MAAPRSDKDPVLVLGAMSDIGRAVARAYGAAGYPLQLAARDIGRLEREAEDLRVRCGVPVSAHEFDVLASARHQAFLDALSPAPGTIVCVVGLMPDQERALRDPSLAELTMRTNYVGPALILEAAAARLQARGGGTLVAVSSVAGDRGRAVNYLYGSAKAGLTAYLSGLRARLAGSGVRVVTVKPGFVDTRMTRGMNLPRALTAQPEEVASAILAAHRKGRDVVYVRPVWRAIMLAIRCLPEPVFKRLRF